MIVEYHRPENLAQALALLDRSDPTTLPLGGGTFLSSVKERDFAVVDLQSLGLNKIEESGAFISIGSTVTLQNMLEDSRLPEALKHALQLEATLNTRNQATIAGRLATSDGSSPLATMLLAMDCRLEWQPGNIQQSLGDWLLLRKSQAQNGVIIQLQIPRQVIVGFASVGRTPMDRPLLCAGMCRWSSGRIRVSLGGTDHQPTLVVDGTEPGDIIEIAKNAYSHKSNKYCSSEYLQENTTVLIRRLLSS